MNEALILERLDSLSNEIRSLKSGVLEELKQDLAPIVKQASPHVIEFFSDLDGQYSNEQLGALLKNILANTQNLNTMLASLKAGLELKEDLAPVAKQALPKVQEFMAELDGQFDSEDIGALLRNTLGNLKNINKALEMLKAGMELKEDLGPVAKQGLPKVQEIMAELDGQFDMEDVGALLRNTLGNLKNINKAMEMLKAGMELKEDLGPVAKQSLPKLQEFMAELDGHVEIDDLTALLRKTLSNLHHLNTAMDMLKSSMELKEDMGPVIKMVMPKVQQFMADLHEGEFQAEQLGYLMRTFLLNVQTFSELMSLLAPMTELINEVGTIAKTTDVFGRVNKTLDNLQHCGLMRLSGTVMTSLKQIDCNSAQVEKMCETIAAIDFKKSNKVTAFGMLKKMKDPRVQEALGAMFTTLEIVGAMLESYRQQES